MMEDTALIPAYTPHPGGRPSDYKPEFCQKVAELCIAGATDFEVATELGVSTRTIYRWRAQYPEFCHAMRIGKELADERVEASLYHRAVGYNYPAVKIMQNAGAPVIVPYTEHIAPDVGAATLWLTNRQGDKWRTKQVVEHNGPNDGPLQVAVKMAAALAVTEDPNDAATLYAELAGGKASG